MSLPAPVPGLVIRYSYLWKREHDSGRDEGVKDRPCAVLLAIKDRKGEMIVTVLPITHSAPAARSEAVEIPPRTKERLGLDAGRSWVVITEVNRFVWPGPDLRSLPGQGAESVALGLLPRGLYTMIRERFLALDRQRKINLVRRTE